MAKAPKFGVNNYRGSTRKKRPGRHAKNLTKNFLEKYIEVRDDEICT